MKAKFIKIITFKKALGYCDIKGQEKARIAIRDYHRSKGIRNITENDIFIGNGMSEVAYMIITALIGKDDEVLMPAPCYSLWTNLTFLTGGKVRFYQCDEQNEWQPDIEAIKNSITAKTKAIVIINPNNPTGAMQPVETRWFQSVVVVGLCKYKKGTLKAFPYIIS